MKLEEIQEANTKGKPIRYTFSVNRQEAILILSLLNKARIYIPKNDMTFMIQSRINTMLKTFAFAFRMENKYGIDFEPIPKNSEG